MGFVFLILGSAFALALFFVREEYASRVAVPALIFFTLFLIDAPIYNRISEKNEKDKHSDDA